MAHVVKAFLVLIAGVFAINVHAQPGDVTGVDIRIVEAPGDHLEVQVRPNAPWSFSDGVLNFTFAVRWETAAGGALNSNLIDQVFQGGPPFCMQIGAPMSGTSGIGIDNIDDDGFRYKSFDVSGNQFPSACVFTANEWVPFARVPFSGVTGCANFEIIRDDDFVIANNTGWFISLGGVDVTANSQVVGPGVEAGNCIVDCNGIVGGPAVPGSACDPGDQCVVDAVLNDDCECVGLPVGGPLITSITESQDICENTTLSLSVEAQGTGSIGYLWSGAGAFLPSAELASVEVSNPVSGSYSVSVADACGTVTGDVLVTVTNVPEPVITAIGPLCSNSAAVALSATPEGGIWSGTGVSGSSFDPSVGSQTVNYTVTVDGCTGSVSRVITVNAAPEPVITAIGPLCSNSSAVALSATPAGGTWSGSGVSGSSFDPSVGSQTVNYTVTVDGCTGSVSRVITVTAAPEPVITALGPLCSNSAAVALSATPAGGTWSGSGVSGSSFDPSAGSQTVNYAVTVDGCTGSSSLSISVTPTPEPSIASLGSLCNNSGIVLLSGTPAGGTWSGNGVTGSSFDPSVGTQTVNYSVTANGCTGIASRTITVVTAPTATFTVESTNVYVNAPVEFENGSSAGSNFWDFGDGSSSTSVSPTHSYDSLGEYTVTLIVEAAGCADTLQIVMVVDLNTGLLSAAIGGVRVWAVDEHINVAHTDPSHPQLLVQVLDAGGRLHLEKVMPANTGKLMLPAESLSSGVWLVLLRSDTKAEVHRVVLVR